ncbi:unnamed protein product [Diabrotica balteata]|uniref:ABC transporter domain-containing protein n=1 Tax=Diabrotica balteata TaxID=107213 RepID=A0A9N9TAV4_DIABA|nr:unnamed protein product [Diabrotica balteata]
MSARKDVSILWHHFEKDINSHKISPGVAGLVILQVFQLMGTLQFATQKSLDFVQFLMSIERMVEFSKIETEEFSDSNKNGVYKVQAGSSGAEIIFKNVSMFYNKGSLVLNDINVTISSGEKVGVVGRTGAGKSSLINVLLRLSEFNGSVLINGVDTRTIPLEILRKRVSIIPQDPVLFTNTVRYNLDPLGEFTDDNLWTIIEEPSPVNQPQAFVHVQQPPFKSQQYANPSFSGYVKNSAQQLHFSQYVREQQNQSRPTQQSTPKQSDSQSELDKASASQYLQEFSYSDSSATETDHSPSISASRDSSMSDLF